jgi:flagellar basal-body rod protein FlgB
MVFNSSFDKSLDLLKRGMDVSLLRYNITANNIANAETPNFKRSSVSFESELKRMLDLEKKQPPFEGALMYDRSKDMFRARNSSEVKPRVTLDYLTTSKNNGNNVDIEEEIMTATNTQLLYQAMLTSVNGAFQRVNIALSMRA